MAQESLRVMIARIEERQVGIAENIGEIKTIFEKHTEQDAKEFEIIRKEISSMNRYAASIAIVAGTIGACATWLWSKLTGQV